MPKKKHTKKPAVKKSVVRGNAIPLCVFWIFVILVLVAAGIGWAVALAPLAAVGGAFFVGVKRKQAKAFAVFMGLTLGIFAVLLGSYIGIRVAWDQHHWAAEGRRFASERAQREERTMSTIAPAILEIFPHAQFNIYRFGTHVIDGVSGWTVIELKGYSFNDMPDFEKEMHIWQQLSERPEFINYPNFAIYVRYFFENEQHNFAEIRLDNRRTIPDFSFGNLGMHYNWLGVPMAEVERIVPLIEEFLSDYPEDFRVELPERRGIWVVVYTEPGDLDEVREEQRWAAFVEDAGFVREMVSIEVFFPAPGEGTRGVTSYHIPRDWWTRR